MKQIILASKSKARRELLKVLAVKCKVIIPKIKEEKYINLSYSALVKLNALNKVKDAAKRVKKGVIIAADTIAVYNNKIIGKPKNIKEAKKMLRQFSKKPQWIYTGLAVIDIDSGKQLCDFEKTKFWLEKLSENEMNSYFSLVSPLDKAGGFDIQGKGALFIKRIEGCFYNVVGLPLAKLYKMLKEVGVDILR